MLFDANVDLDVEASSKVKSAQPICELVEVDGDAYDSSDCFDSHEESRDSSIQ